MEGNRKSKARPCESKAKIKEAKEKSEGQSVAIL